MGPVGARALAECGLVDGKGRTVRSALALMASLVAALGILGASGLNSAAASSGSTGGSPTDSTVTSLKQLVAQARVKETFLLNQVQTARKMLAQERAEVQRARAQLASLISAEYTGSPDGLLQVLASDSLSQALDTQITLSRLTDAERGALHQVVANLQAERRNQKTLVLAQQQAVVTEKRLQAEEIVAAFEAANPPPPPKPAVQPTSSPKATKPASATTPASPTPSPSPTATPTPTVTPSAPPPSPSPSPSSGPFSVTTNLTQPSGITLGQIQQFLQGSPLEADAGYFMTAQATNHVSAIYLVADAVLETGWGTSQLYLEKHNLFGFQAYDANPFGDGASFPSDQACISFVSWYVWVNYLTPPGYSVPNYPGQPGEVATGAFYNGPTPAGMNVDYASDPSWAEKIAQIGDVLQSFPG